MPGLHGVVHLVSFSLLLSAGADIGRLFMFNLILMNTVLLNGKSRRIVAPTLTMILYLPAIVLLPLLPHDDPLERTGRDPCDGTYYDTLLPRNQLTRPP